MSFLAPLFLWGLIAVAVPVIIHLLQRRRVVQVPFSTLRFLRLVQAKTSRRSRIENLLLLLLRCLTYALLFLAAAKPVLTAQAAKFFGGNVPRTVVLIIDQSMSMGYRAGELTRLEAAKSDAVAILDDLKPGDEVAVIAASDRAQLLVAEPTVDHAVARQAVNSVQQTEARTDFSAALREARRIGVRSTKGVKQCFLLTDNQEGGWGFNPNGIFDDDWRKSGLQLIVVRPDNLTPVNAAVRQIAFKSPFVTPGSTIRGAATVENFSSAPLHDVLEVKLGDERVAQRPVDADSGATVEVPFEFPAPPLTGRSVNGMGKIQGDNLPADDRFFFALPVYQPPRVLIVEGSQIGEDRLHSGYFLQKAFSVGGGKKAGGVGPKAIGASELDEASLDGYSGVFLADVPKVSDRASVRLERYLQGGGVVVFFLGDQSSMDNLSKLEFLPAKPTGVKELPVGRLASHVLEPDHPLFANAWDSETPFPALPQHKVFDWMPAKDSKVLITIGDNVPFLIVGDRGAGKVVVVNASADRTWGDLPLSPAFLPLLQQLARWSAEQIGKQTGCVVGNPVPLAPYLPRDQTLTVTLPDGKTRTVVPAESAVLMERADQAGFYDVTSPREGTLQQFAVNVDPLESRLKPMDPATLAKLAPHQLLVGLDELRIWLEHNRGLVPLWPWILLLALIVFGLESILANVMARSRSQAEATHIRTGRLNKRRMFQPFRAPKETEAPEPEAVK